MATQNNQAEYTNFIDLLCRVGLGGIAALGAWSIIHLMDTTNYKNSPQKKIESGYVDQSQLEIKATDFDNNKKNETILKYKGIEYLFKEDETGKPVAIPYSIVPQQIVPQYEK